MPDIAIDVNTAAVCIGVSLAVNRLIVQTPVFSAQTFVLAGICAALPTLYMAANHPIPFVETNKTYVFPALSALMTYAAGQL